MTNAHPIREATQANLWGAARARLGVVVLGLALFGCGGPTAEKTGPTPGQATDAGADEAAAEAAQIQAIASALNEFSPAVHTCWARGAADDFRLDGQIVLAVDIGEGGASKVEAIEDTAGDAVLKECLTSLWSSYRWPSVFEAGDRIQLPPFDFVAPMAQYSVAAPHVPKVALGQSGVSAQVLVDQKNSGNGQASMTLVTIEAKREVPLHSHSSAEVLFVLRGEGLVRGPGAAQAVGPGSAIYVPKGMPHGFVAGDSEVEVVQLYAPGGPEGRFRDSANTSGTEAFAGKLPKRGKGPVVKAAAQADAYAIAGGKAEIRIVLDEAITKDEAAYVGALTAQPGTLIPLHRHGDSSEYLLVLEGTATMQVAGKSLQIQAGDAVQIPTNVEHGAEIGGTEAFKALQFYAPAGPEQRFKAGGPTNAGK